jgi:hypothetical protein
MWWVRCRGSKLANGSRVRVLVDSPGNSISFKLSYTGSHKDYGGLLITGFHSISSHIRLSLFQENV